MLLKKCILPLILFIFWPQNGRYYYRYHCRKNTRLTATCVIYTSFSRVLLTNRTTHSITLLKTPTTENQSREKGKYFCIYCNHAVGYWFIIMVKCMNMKVKHKQFLCTPLLQETEVSTCFHCIFVVSWFDLFLQNAKKITSGLISFILLFVRVLCIAYGNIMWLFFWKKTTVFNFFSFFY